MILLLTTFVLIIADVSSFVLPKSSRTSRRRKTPREDRYRAKVSISATANDASIEITWSPQDLTKDNPGFLPIPCDDYIKKYQENLDLWPVEFFLVPYRRRIRLHDNNETETQILVRKSANGTSRYGLGTGVPVTRWMVSTGKPPYGYEWSEPPVLLEASTFPEFPKASDSGVSTKSWTYRKIDIRADAFQGDGVVGDLTKFYDPQLQEYAKRIRDHLKTTLSATLNDGREDIGQWEIDRISLVQRILESDNSVAAIQGTLRMSGIFEKGNKNNGGRYVDFDKWPDPADLARSVKIYTMFPQMPDPMPLPSTSPEVLKEEILNRPTTMKNTGRNPHKDKHGRTYTHISTSNVSNTIHGIYLTLDATNYFPAQLYEENDEIPPALDLFGSKGVPREWKSLEELKVLDVDGEFTSTDDPKSTFISGFIARQLVKDNVVRCFDKNH